MCSELLRIPLSLDGVPIFGFGALLAAWLLFGAWGLVSTAKAAGWPAALRAHLPTIVLVAAAIALFIPRYFPEGVPIRGYGVMVLAGSVAGIALAIHRGRPAGIGAEEIMGLAVAMFVGGVVGARLFYVVEYWDQRIRHDDWPSTLRAALSFTEGGLVIYGAFFGAMAAFAWYVRRRRLPALAMADMIAASMLVGLALGRLGCLLNGCCYGGESTVPWAVTFPRESSPDTISPPYAEQAATGRFYGFRIEPGAAGAPPVVAGVDAGSPAEAAGLRAGMAIAAVNDRTTSGFDGAQAALAEAFHMGQEVTLKTAGGETVRLAAVTPPARSRPVHPAQVYSAITAALIAWVLWSYYPFRRRDGEVTALMITLYPIARYLEELIRVDEPAVFGTGLSISQNVSVLLLAAAGLLWWRILRRPRGQLAFPAEGEPAV